MHFWTFMEKALLNDLLSIKATEQNFHLIMYTQLFKVVVKVLRVWIKSPTCDPYWNESHLALLSIGTISFAVQVLTFMCGLKASVDGFCAWKP